MTWKNCAASVREAAGRDLSDDQVIEIFERAQTRLKAIEAAGNLDGIDRRLREAMATDAGQLRIEAALARKNAALQVIAADKTGRHADGLMNGRIKPQNAPTAVIEGTVKGVTGGRRSVQATRYAYEARFIGQITSRIVREVPHAEGMLRERGFLDNIVREMMRPNSTADADARKVAAIFRDASEASRLELNRLGANIGKLDEWAGPQIHDGDRIGKAGKDAWINAILPKLDLQRTFPDLATDADVRRVLGSVWENIVFQPERGGSPDLRGSAFKSPPNLARTLEQNRVLHFRDADNWLAYSREFGRGHIFDAIVHHQSHAAQTAALMEWFGPNPGLGLDALLDRIKRRVDADDGIPPERKEAVKRSLTTDPSSALGMAFRIANGQHLMAVSRTAANVGSTVRAAQAWSKLGGAVVSAITDLPIAIANLRFNGMSFAEAAGGQVREFLRGRGKGEAREVAFLLGEGFDGVIGHMISPFIAQDTAPGAVQAISTQFFRWTGLTLWTDANRAGAARVLGAFLGRQASKSYDQLNARTRNVFAQHGITPEVWDVIRTQGVRQYDGKPYLVPEAIEDRNAAMILQAYYSDEMQFSVLEADAATQRWTTGGTSRGTFWGEVIRFIMQFKGFPIAFTQRVLGRAAFGGEGGASAGPAHIGTLIAALTVMGYAAMTAKDAIRGYEPREIVDENGNPRMATILAALVQGGGAGIYGDFLFGEASRSGNSALENLAGPAASDVARWFNLYARARDGDGKAADALSAAIASTPFANVWFARPVLDLLVLNELREMLSPGFLARQDQRRREQFGQDPLIAPQDRMALDLF